MAGTSGLTYGVDITSRSQLIDALNSQRVFFDDASGLNELEPSASPFITLLMGISKQKASGDLESYIEHRGSYITDNKYYISAAGTTAITALAANAALYTDMSVSLTNDGAAIDPYPFEEGDILLLVNPEDTTQTASILVVSDDASGTTLFNWRLLTATPGFNITTSGATQTYCYHVSRMFGEGSDESAHRYEIPVTCWNEIGSFKESYKITDQLAATSQIVYGDELMRQLKWAQLRLMRDADRALLYASRRINCTNPFSAPGSSPLTDTDGNVIRTSISLRQGIEAAAAVGIGGTRIFKHTASTMTPDDLDLSIIEQFKYGSESKRVIAGDGAIQALITMSRKNNQYQMTSGDTAFGLKWKKYITPNAELDITRHRGMTGALSNAMFVIDTKYVSLRQLIPLYTEKLTGNSTSKKWEMRWDIGLRMKFPEAHGLWFFM